MKKRIFNQISAFILLLSLSVMVVPATYVRPAGIDLAGMDRSINPGDDFFGYTNGNWIKSSTIPNDRTSLGNFDLIFDVVSKRTADLITEASKSSTPEGKMVGDYYAAYLDEAAIESRCLEPLNAELAEIAKIKDLQQLSTVLGSQLRADVDPLNATNFYTDRLFGAFISADFNNPTKNVAYLLQGGLGMPDRDNYTNGDAERAALQDKYKAHIAAILKLAKTDDADGRAARIYDLEQKIAQTHATREESSDVHKANNPWRIADFKAKAPGIEWNSYLKAAKLDKQKMIMAWHPKAIAGISALVASQPLSVWKEYLNFRIIDRSAGLLPKAFADENFKFYRKELYGVPQPRPRIQRAINTTSGALGDVVGKMYVEKYFPPRAKTEIQTLVKNIVDAFGKRIDALTWMTPETKAKAKAKLSTLYVGVGYPETWRNYSGLKIVANDALGNAQRIGKFNYDWSLSKLDRPVDKHEWWMTPQTVNAVNLPLQNALNFPAAILNPPFFDMNADPVENYGSIGGTIGHEISHSFDDTGSQFDAEGKLLNWWTPQDYEHFQASSAKLAAQYDAYEPLPGLHLNGKQTLGENIADVAGLSAAYDAYRAAYGGKPAPDANGLTGDQLFFVAFGQSWRAKRRPETLRVIVMTDGHSPEEFRADTVRNIDGWYDAFDVKPGSKLYLAPEARVKIW
ncbi:MAG TPA: M13 family metallopeptidase [Pyrinomonadaceae bacterium]|nr:M13 family metallopeptidase [Pyrinomonadaceae bacterium]